MSQGNQGVMVQQKQNPIQQFQVKYKELQFGLKVWLSKQPIHVEAAVATLASGLQGAAIGGLMGAFNSSTPSAPPPQAPLTPEAMASFKQAQALSGGPLVQARNFAVMTGVNAGISCVLRRVRGKEDVQSSMAAAFGSGVVFSLVSGMGGTNMAGNALTSGFFFALFQGGLYQVGQKIYQPPVEDTKYSRTRNMLSSLGLQSYEKNFKRGLLTDNTLPLLTDSALRDVKIPPGPRLLILDQISRNEDLKEGK